jgi:hypothetical protein
MQDKKHDEWIENNKDFELASGWKAVLGTLAIVIAGSLAFGTLEKMDNEALNPAQPDTTKQNARPFSTP